jgi:hypothetical protein
MYQLAADLQIWQLHSRRLVHVREGAFLQPPGAPAAPPPPPPPAAAPAPAAATAAGAPAWPQDPAGLAAAASALAAAVTSAVASGLAPLAEQLAAAGAAPQREAASSAERAAPAPPVADLGPEARAFVEQHLPLLDVPWGIKLQLEAAGVSGLRVVTPAALRPLLRRLGQPFFERMSVRAAVELLEFCCGDLLQAPDGVSAGTDARRLDGSGGGSGGRLHGYPSPPQPGVGAAPVPARHPGRVRDLVGLPIPTAAGTVGPLGSAQLLVVPPLPAAPQPPLSPRSPRSPRARRASAASHPVASGLLPPALGGAFVNEAVVAALEAHLRDPELRRELKLQYYGVPQIAVHLKAALGPEWVARDGGGGGGGDGAAGAAAPWDGAPGTGPARWWLRNAWQLVQAAIAAAPAWGASEAAAARDALGPLLLVPLAGGRLLRAGLLEAALVADGSDDDALRAGGDGGSQGGAGAQELWVGAWELQGCVPWGQGVWLVWFGRRLGRDCLPSSADALATFPLTPPPSQSALPAPWGWLTPMLAAGGLPIIAADFAPLLAPLTGPRPRVGRPPFLGPLVRKLAAADAAGLLKPEAWSVEVGGRRGRGLCRRCQLGCRLFSTGCVLPAWLLTNPSPSATRPAARTGAACSGCSPTTRPATWSCPRCGCCGGCPSTRACPGAMGLLARTPPPVTRPPLAARLLAPTATSWCRWARR